MGNVVNAIEGCVYPSVAKEAPAEKLQPRALTADEELAAAKALLDALNLNDERGGGALDGGALVDANEEAILEVALHDDATRFERSSRRASPQRRVSVQIAAAIAEVVEHPPTPGGHSSEEIAAALAALREEHAHAMAAADAKLQKTIELARKERLARERLVSAERSGADLPSDWSENDGALSVSFYCTYRYFVRILCSQFDSLPLTYSGSQQCAGDAAAARRAQSVLNARRGLQRADTAANDASNAAARGLSHRDAQRRRLEARRAALNRARRVAARARDGDEGGRSGAPGAHRGLAPCREGCSAGVHRSGGRTGGATRDGGECGGGEFDFIYLIIRILLTCSPSYFN